MELGLLADSLGRFRKSLIRVVIVTALLWTALYPFHNRLLSLLSRPFPQELAFFKVTEAFYATLKVSLYGAVFLVMPLVFAEIWRFLAPIFFRNMNRHTLPVALAASFLFYSGVAICYFIVLPRGIIFLTSYGVGQMEPLISVDRYLTFTVAFMFGFGLSFQMPLGMLLLSQVGLVNHRMLSRNRRYAILILVIIAAVVTPTPDVYNMSLMAGPLLALYEISIVLVWLFGKKG